MIRSMTPDQAERWGRALDLVSLAVGQDNDCQAADVAVRAIRTSELRGMIAAVLGVAAGLVDLLAHVTEEDAHDLLARLR